jgi:hypothetical protein
MKKRLVESKKDTRFKILGLDISQISLIISNTILLLGVILYNWKVSTIILIYYAETIVIGLYFILKKIKYNNYKKINKFPISFTLYYIIILAGYLIFILFIASIADARENNTLVLIKGHDSTQITGLNLFRLLDNNILAILTALLILMINHGISFYTNFIKNKEYEKVDMDNLEDKDSFSTKPIFKEFRNRILIVHLTILIGGALILLLNSNTYLILFMIVLKIIFDLSAHNEEHNTPIFKKK